ncbi:MAG TPA: DUF1707 domain-containing protein [Trebonia sp.]|jgi:hypothetical protein|nr:DUF1707 domain-containing protein [Trebonia sp.]
MAMRYYAPFPDRNREPYKPLPRNVLRIGDVERDAAAADLGEHYVAGRLTLDELHERLGQVFAAKTHGQLWKVMADLPGARPTVPRPLPSPRVYQGKQETPSDRAGRYAALALLMLAMLIWLFTALLFAHHGYYQPGPPWHPGGH